ncbi:hypothetical protein BGP_3396 [Beggiatoa sp. PS]|nr:hypothetical protein BGP_3396 [Beggiatoa sp. PS]
MYVREGKANNTKVTIYRNLFPKISFVNGDKSGLILLPKSCRDSVIFDNRVRTQIHDKLDGSLIPFGYF